MRIVLSCLVLFFIASSKAQTPPSLSTKQQQKTVEASKLQEISYKRQSRQGNSLITFSPKKIVIYSSTKKSESLNIPKKEWDSIQYLVSKIAISQLLDLKAPTDKRLYDGAASATLTIVKDKKSWVSSPFDDGYPPTEISKLIYKLLSLEEGLLKN
ncbi:MAG: hypothetical protein AAGH46_08865 [Bacteroidota bacterium]